MLLKLPLEVVELIVLKLSYDDILNISSCCKVLHEVATNEGLWEKCAKRDFNVNLKCSKKKNCSNLKENVDRSFSARAFVWNILRRYGKALQRTYQRTNYAYYGGLVKLLYHNYMLHFIDLDPPAFPSTHDPLQTRVICQVFLSPKSNKTVVVRYLEYKPKPSPYGDTCSSPTYSFDVNELNRPDETRFTISLRSTPCPLPEVMELNNEWYHMQGDEVKETELSKRLGIPRDMAKLRSRHQTLYILEGSQKYRAIEEQAFHPSYPIQPGFFKATYGYHGNEIIQLKYSERSNEIVASKITGDPNVPFGEIVFKAYTDKPINRDMMSDGEEVDYFDNLRNAFDRAMKLDKGNKITDRTQSPQPFHLPKGYLLSHDVKLTEFKECKWRFMSKFQIAMPGFQDSRYVDAHMVVFSEDSFAIISIDIRSLKICHRVKEKLNGIVNYDDFLKS